LEVALEAASLNYG